MLKRHRVEGLPETSCGQSPLAERTERPTNLAQRLLDRQLEAEVTKRESLESQLREAHQTLRETERERAAPVPAPLGAQSSSLVGQKEGVAGSSQSGSLVGFWAQLETQLQVLGPHELLRLK